MSHRSYSYLIDFKGADYVDPSDTYPFDEDSNIKFGLETALEYGEMSEPEKKHLAERDRHVMERHQ